MYYLATCLPLETVKVLSIVTVTPNGSYCYCPIKVISLCPTDLRVAFGVFESEGNNKHGWIPLQLSPLSYGCTCFPGIKMRANDYFH